MTSHSELTAEDVLRLWDEECQAHWPSGVDPAAEVNGFWLEDIAATTHGRLSGVWGATPLRRARPRVDLSTRERLTASIVDLDAAIEALEGDGRAYFIRLRDLVGWVIERPREALDPDAPSGDKLLSRQAPTDGT